MQLNNIRRNIVGNTQGWAAYQPGALAVYLTSQKTGVFDSCFTKKYVIKTVVINLQQLNGLLYQCDTVA